MKHRQVKAFRRLIAVLRERCPAAVPVRVRRLPPSRLPAGIDGDCAPYYDENGRLSHFQIRLRNNLPWEACWESLIHEWAHAISWRDGHETLDDHDEAWGLAYAFCYRETE